MEPLTSSTLKPKLGRVAITGATGFVGGHLAEHMREQGAEVVCVCRRSSNLDRLSELGFVPRVFDFSDSACWRDELAGVDAVFHLAAATAARSPREFYQANTELTARIARAAANLERPPILVYCSSVAAAGPVPRGVVRLPGTPIAPVSNYGRSKRGGELAIAALANRLPATIVRPGIVFGPRNQELFPVFESIARVRTHFVPGFRTPRLTFIHVADLVELLLRAARCGRRLPSGKSTSAEEPEREGELANSLGVYFAVHNESFDYRELGNRVARALGLRHLTLHVPHPLPWLIAAGVEVWSRLNDQSPPFQIDKIREAAATSWECRDSRLTDELGFQFPYDLQTRLEQTAAWYSVEGWLGR